jgi:hypothetical protein
MLKNFILASRAQVGKVLETENITDAASDGLRDISIVLKDPSWLSAT